MSTSTSAGGILATLSSELTFSRVLVLTTGFALIKLRHQISRPVYNWGSPLRHLPGPAMDSYIFGNLYTLLQETDNMVIERWIEKHGKTFRFRRFFGAYQLCTTDMRAVNFMMSHNMTFPKAERLRRALAQLLGDGLLAADEETHKRQRRIMNPSFGVLHVKNLVPTFWTKTNQLRDIWLDILRENPDGAEIEVLSWLTRATLDIIGVAGFGYEFHSLEDEDKDELAKAFTEVFNSNQSFSQLSVLKDVVCGALGIPTEDSRRFKANLAIIRRIGMGLVNDKKTLLQESKESEESRGRDILTLLIKSNIAADVDKNQALTDEEVFGQIATFLAAGHETTSSSTSWALYALSKHPEVQTKLRHELQSAGLGEEPSMDEIEKLSYLNNFVREVLRAYAVVPLTSREAGCDTVVPVGEGYTDLNGVVRNEIHLQKGDSIAIPILAMHRDKDVWGEDAMEFRPERWDNLPSSVKDMPGVWSHMMTFLHGPHACIGFRFALIEMKVLLYALVRAFEFEIDPSIEIEGKTGLVTRPCVKGQAEKANRMPLLCKPVARSQL